MEIGTNHDGVGIADDAIRAEDIIEAKGEFGGRIYDEKFSTPFSSSPQKNRKNVLEKTAMRKALAGQIAAIEARAQPGSFHGEKLETAEKKDLKTTTEKMANETVGPLAKRLDAPHRIQLGIEKIDQALDAQNAQGIVAAGLHEIYSPTTLSFSSALGFGLVLGNLLARQNQSANSASLIKVDKGNSVDGPIFWIGDSFCLREGGGFYGPGLHALGIAPERIVHVRTGNLEEAIWAAGEVARSTKSAFGFLEVRGNPHKLDLATTRRLLLRCQRSYSSLFILRQAGEAQASAANTRWRVMPWRSGETRFENKHQNFEHMDLGRKNPVAGNFGKMPGWKARSMDIGMEPS